MSCLWSRQLVHLLRCVRFATVMIHVQYIVYNLAALLQKLPPRQISLSDLRVQIAATHDYVVFEASSSIRGSFHLVVEAYHGDPNNASD